MKRYVALYVDPRIPAQWTGGHCGDSVEAQDIRLEENPHWAGQLLPTKAG